MDRKKGRGSVPEEKAGRKRGRERGSPGGPKKAGQVRVPAIVMVPVGLTVGWFVANWAGAVFGGIVGVFLWRSRA